jgi:hypothetical protein
MRKTFDRFFQDIPPPIEYLLFVLVCAAAVMAVSPPLLLPDGSLRSGVRITIPAGTEKELLFRPEGVRFLSRRARITSVGAPHIDRMDGK